MAGIVQLGSLYVGSPAGGGPSDTTYQGQDFLDVPPSSTNLDLTDIILLNDSNLFVTLEMRFERRLAAQPTSMFVHRSLWEKRLGILTHRASAQQTPQYSGAGSYTTTLTTDGSNNIRIPNVVAGGVVNIDVTCRLTVLALPLAF